MPRNVTADLTDKLIEALVHVRVSKAHAAEVESTMPPEEMERVRQEHLAGALAAIEDAGALVRTLIEG